MSGLSAHLVDQISAMLASHGIRHAPLREGTPHLNLNLHDQRRVFVKVSRPGERHGRAAREITGSAWAAAHGINTPVALLDHVIELLDEDGEIREVTVWKWLTSASATSLVDQSRIVSAFVADLARLPLPDGVADFDLDFFLTRVHDRLDTHPDPVSRSIVTAADTEATNIRRALDPTRYVWIHGDLHFKNVHWQVRPEPVLLDWESHCRGPVEWDVAQLFRSIDRDFPEHMDSEKHQAALIVRQIIENRLDVDWNLVGACGRFRAASSASHLLLHGHNAAGLAADLHWMRSSGTDTAEHRAA